MLPPIIFARKGNKNMIKHIVCFKLKDNSEEKKNEAKNIILSMVGKVETVKALEVGIDFLGSPRSYDIFIQATLDSKEALDAYQQDDYHCNVFKKYMHAVTESSVAVDYEID